MTPLPLSYSYHLVVISVVLSMTAAYAAFGLADRMRFASSSFQRYIWLAGGSAAMGIGIWSMHYLGMLAVKLPVTVDYYLPTVVLSLLFAVAASAVALLVVSAGSVDWEQQALGGILMGAGIGGMHYIGMAAMRSSAMPMYSTPIVALSIVVAIVFSTLALRMASFVRSAGERVEGVRIGAGALMGLAIASMHYIAMSAASFMPDALTYSAAHTVHIDALGEIGVSVTAGIVLLVALFSAYMDKRVYFRLTTAHSALAESQQALLKSEQALKDANAMLRELSVRDGLTGLHNRRYFDERFQVEWNRAVRSRQPLALILLDVDRFKLLNDTHGHQYGDECLREVARVLTEQSSRGEDLVARFGGEEFVVLLPMCELAGAEAISESIRLGVLDAKIVHQSSATGIVTISAGVTSWTPDEDDLPETMLRITDEAMYAAKQGGRNQVKSGDPMPPGNLKRALKTSARRSSASSSRRRPAR